MAVEITETPRHTLTVNEQNWSLALTAGPAGPAGPAGAAGPNSVTSATTSDGTADINFNQVGIGLTDPDTELEVGGTIKASTHLDAIVIGSPTTVKWKMGAYGGNDLLVKNASNSTRLIIKGTGNVGIGTTSPSQKLHVVGNTITTGVFYTDIVQTYSGSSIDFRHQDASVVMRVDTPNARIGIGTTTPAAKLHVSGSMGSGIDGADKTGIRLTNTPNGLTWRIGSGSGGVNHSWFTIARAGQSPALTIDSSDKVGIGITNPSQKLDVDGAVKKAVFTVNTLPTATAGTSCYVSDSNHTHHSNVGQVVVSGGSIFVPVYYDGTDWRIG